MEQGASRARRGVSSFYLYAFMGVFSVSALAACGGDDVDGASGGDSTTAGNGGGGSGGDSAARPEGWTEETHGKDASASYDVVFDQAAVNRIDITIDPSEWKAMMDDMTSMLGEFGEGGMGPVGGGGPMGPPPELFEACVGKAEGDPCEFAIDGNPGSGECGKPPMASELICMGMVVGGPGPGGGPGGPGGDDAEFLPRSPIYVRAAVHFKDRTWWNVGLRLKGNSTLTGSWMKGVYKLPFRLKFDEFEGEHPEIEDQRFYGFKLLSLTSSAMDPSYLREKVVADVLRDGGIPAAQTTFVRIFIDRGEGPTYFGLYTLVEIPDKPLLRAQLGGDKGNLYKPQGTGARWGMFDEASFEKKTNEEEADYSDIIAAIGALNASQADPAAWRAGLEATFNVDGFLRWFALNTVIGNWDTYGAIPHNYFLYGNPEDGGRISWIPWDHDLALGRGDPLMHDEADASWPLIRLLLDDPVYRAQYIKHADAAAMGAFSPMPLAERLTAEHERIKPYVVGPEGEQPGYTFISSPEAFEASLSGPEGVIAYVMSRHQEVIDELTTVQ